MARQTYDVGTLTRNNEVQRMRDTYKRCALLNVIEHIDIYGKIRSNYAENRKKGVSDASVAVSSVSCVSPKFSRDVDKQDVCGLDEKLSKFSMSTKISSLYPGNDILSKKTQNGKLKKFTTKNNIAFGSLVLR